MYRDYENPVTLELELKKIKKAFKEETDEYNRVTLHELIEELEERINFAWQDQEA